MPIDLSSYGVPTSKPRLERRGHARPRRPWRQAVLISLLSLLSIVAMPVATEYAYLLRLIDPTALRPFGLARQYEPIVRHYAQWYGLDPALLTAMIRVESNFNPRAISDKGALGLMQLMPDTIAYWRITDPLNPHQNIRGGALQMRYLLHRFEDNLELAIAAYHAGATQITRYDGIPPFPSTHQYVQNVLRTYHELRPAPSHDL